MAVRKIRLFGDPVLSSRAEPITQFDSALRRLVDDLLETTDLPGRAGVAAPQIGVSKRAFSFNVDGHFGYVVNPELVETAGKSDDSEEGCLSVPGMWRSTARFRYAVVRGVDIRGEPITVSGEGILARCLQHEVDHLNGLLYIDHLDRPAYRDALREIRNSEWFWGKGSGR